MPSRWQVWGQPDGRLVWVPASDAPPAPPPPPTAASEGPGAADGCRVQSTADLLTEALQPEEEGCIYQYLKWVQQDQFVLSALLSSLSEEILAHVLFLSTSAEVWKVIESMFASRSRARIMQIRMQLSNLRKKDASISDYFRQMKSLADTLASVGKPLNRIVCSGRTQP